MTTVFGPVQYTRMTGAPRTFTATFEHCGTAPCRIVVVNGNADCSRRISAASISLNGLQVLRPSDLNPHVGRVVRPVKLEATNRLVVRVASKPGSFITVSVECLTSPAALETGPPGVSLIDPMNLSVALPIMNVGTAPAENLQLTSIALAGGTLISPALPFTLGTIPAQSSLTLNAVFGGGPFAPGASYALTLEGTYGVGAATYCFMLAVNLVIPPASPGDAPLGVVSVNPNRVIGAPFPPRDPDFREEDVNNAGWTVPMGPFVPLTPTPGMTMTLMAPPVAAPAGLQGGAEGGGASIVFLENNSMGLTTGISTTAEPSGGSTAGGVVFATVNWRAAYSADGGNSFTAVNPTTIFPADALGFCCDQVVQYAPSIDRFIWLLQGNNGYRLAVASPADIMNSGATAWTYWNLNSTLFGQCNGFDYPDLSLGNNFLYLSWDAFTAGNCNGGFQVARTSLAGLQAGGTITIEFTDPSRAPMAWGSHIMQDTGDEVFWAGHNNNSQMRVFSLAENSNRYFWRDVNISSWANNSPITTSLTPDNRNWVNFLFNPTTQNPGGGFPANAVLGATRSGNQLWLAWSAGTNNFFQQPHVQMVTLDRANNFRVIQQVQIWNNSYGFAYPCLATDACSGEVGLSLEYGGNGNYENHVVGFWGDFVVYITTGSNVGTTRYGDYVTLRQHPPTAANPGNLFSAYGYGLNSAPGGGTMVDVHYVLFGRPASVCDIIGSPEISGPFGAFSR
jgi:hypothetical protein